MVWSGGLSLNFKRWRDS